MIFQKKAKIIKNIQVTPRYYKMILSLTQIAKTAKPGQFLQIKVSNGDAPLLRRPFSIHRVNSHSHPVTGSAEIEILYEVLGQGTEILSQRKPGEYLDILGPLGKGFDLPPITYHLSPILVAGGMGVAPLIFLQEKLGEIQNPKSKIQNLVLIGAKTKSKILCEKEFKDLGCEVRVSTDDSTKGYKGKITDLLKQILLTIDYGLSTIYACGPRPMLKEIAKISQDYKIPAQISLEEHLACGIGACLGCAVKTKNGFQRVCKEGPIFNADKIIW